MNVMSACVATLAGSGARSESNAFKHVASALLLERVPHALAKPVLVAAIILAHSLSCAQVTGKRTEDAHSADGRWYFSWGYSRQQYVDSDIHVHQPGEGSDFVVHRAKASDYPAGLGHTVRSLLTLNVTAPQENVRAGRFVSTASRPHCSVRRV